MGGFRLVWCLREGLFLLLIRTINQFPNGLRSFYLNPGLSGTRIVTPSGIPEGAKQSTRDKVL